MKIILLTKGKKTLVDDEDFEYLNQWKWYAQKGKLTYYAERNEWIAGKAVRIRMHRLIMKAEEGQIVDHRDRDGLNNQKRNLRICTLSQNGANKGSRGTSRFLGVSLMQRSYNKKSGQITYQTRWQAVIQINGKQRFLGYFKTEEDAAKRYNEEAIKIHGEFANVNPV